MSDQNSGISKDMVRGEVVRYTGTEPSVRLKPHIGTMLADAYTVISETFRQCRDKVMNGEPLDREERMTFVKFTDAFTKLAKEEREQEKRDDPAKLSDVELVQLVEKARKVLGAGEE